ncbi:MAG: acyl-CoA dehydrogenase family protein [Acidimicrobiales bacterium]
MELTREVSARIALRAEEHDRSGQFPVQDIADLRHAGLLGLLVPEPLTGMGASFRTYAAVARELAAASGATALAFNMHASVTGALAGVPEDLARALGADDAFFAMRDAALRSAAEGSLFQVAMSERAAGSRFSEMSTTYSLQPNGNWRIRGRKSFCTGAGHADVYLVVARSAEGDRFSQFLVPRGPGIVVEPTWDGLGMRATASHDLLLDVEVEADALLGGVEGLALLVARAMPHWLVSSYAAIYVGVADASLRAAAEDLTSRSLSRLPAVRARLGRADTAIAAAWLVVDEAARRVDTEPGTLETNRWVHRAKLIAGDTAMLVASSMVEACGASATRRGHPLERLFRDARCGALHPATSDVCADWLGSVQLGLDPDLDSTEPRW